MSERTKPPRIFVTGFSGTGKSTVAKLLADELGWRALDTDDLVEAIAGKSIGEIFREDGEARFRELEHDVLQSAAHTENAVIATGGGAILSRENRELMASGLVVCLDAPAPEIVSRLGSGEASERPLLAGDEPEARVRELKAARYKFYALSDLAVSSDGLAVEEVAGHVLPLTLDAGAWCIAHPDRLLLPEERGATSEPVWIETASRRYPAYVGWGTLDRLGELMRDQGLHDAAWLISDDTVLPRHGDRALAALRSAGFRAEAFAIPSGESSKSLDTASTVFDWLVSQRAERGHTIVALGGGVVGDLAGFVAATYLRGVSLVMVPTTILSMVDASIGGKVAVDHPRGKNLIGAFYQPQVIVDDIAILKTLPPRTLREGFAEVIKHGLIRDASLVADLETSADGLLHVEPALTVEMIRRNVAIKAAVVAEDERDTGLRAILNYGHTIGHAIEAAADYQGVLHGEAISAGMMAAAEIGRRLGVTPDRVIERQRALFEHYGLPTTAPRGLDAERVLSAMALDKKTSGGVVTWVLLEGAGKAVLRDDIPMDLVREVVSKIVG
jgi:3-dehydroquinate synthase